MDTNEQKQGEAYAFIYSSASEDEIRNELPLVRELARTPSSLEFNFYKGINPKEFAQGTELEEIARDAELGELAIDAKLGEIAQRAIYRGNNYTMRASLKGATNERTSSELNDIINTLYQSNLRETFLKDGEYVGGIVYEKEGVYEFRA